MPVTIHAPKSAPAAPSAPAVAPLSLIDWLKVHASKSEFFASLVSQYAAKGSLSPRQWDAAKSAREKWEAAAAAKAENTFAVDLSAIHNIFGNAMASGLKAPKFHYENVVIYPAKKFPGTLYVKQDKAYAGKVEAGVFSPTFSAKPGLKALLQTVAANPFAAAVSHGKATGQCSCCGRLLTDPKSVALGIGPVCIKKWQLA